MTEERIAVKCGKCGIENYIPKKTLLSLADNPKTKVHIEECWQCGNSIAVKHEGEKEVK